MSDPRLARHEEMRKNGSFNYRANNITAEIFSNSTFFDAYDLIQVKYEMLRAVEKEHHDVSSASVMYGYSRVSFYQIKKEFDKNGITGLMPKKRGPKGSRKLNSSDIEYAKELEKTFTKSQIVNRLKEERGIIISKRTLERELSDKKKL